MAVKTLRIGICACAHAKRYRGRLEGKRFTIKHPGAPLRTFRIREVPVSENYHERDLHRSRCHLFLDVHTDRGKRGYGVFLDLVSLKPNRANQTHVRFGWEERKLSAWWHHERLPSLGSMLLTIRGLVRSVGMNEFPTWLARMTPRGWQMPPLAKFVA